MTAKGSAYAELHFRNWSQELLRRHAELDAARCELEPSTGNRPYLHCRDASGKDVFTVKLTREGGALRIDEN